ncbi:MAG: hypothetical protein QF575_04010 [Acidimicrobiales bacterium]|jgi:hypothetical protein|nr:hypothetical protein [Acidimicrobiales bacterium]
MLRPQDVVTYDFAATSGIEGPLLARMELSSSDVDSVVVDIHDGCLDKGHWRCVDELGVFVMVGDNDMIDPDAVAEAISRP